MTWSRGVRSAAGAAGVVGGALVIASALGGASMEPALQTLGIALIAFCEVGLVAELGRVSLGWALGTVLVLGLAAAVFAIAYTTFVTSGSLAAIGMLAFGLAPWFFLAPVLALAAARARRLAVAPAIGLVVATIGFVSVGAISSGSGSTAIAFVRAVYFAAWAWLVLALLVKGPEREPRRDLGTSSSNGSERSGPRPSAGS